MLNALKKSYRASLNLHKEFGCFWDRKSNPRCLYCRRVLQGKDEDQLLICTECSKVDAEEAGWYPLKTTSGKSISKREAQLRVEYLRK